MSIELMAKVWGLQLNHTEQSILMALADHADEDGRNCFPSIARLGWKTGYSRRQTQRTIRALISQSLIVPIRNMSGGRNQPTEYFIDILKGVKKPPFLSEERVPSDTQKGATMTPFQKERVPSDTQKGAIAMAPEPSLTVIKKKDKEALASLKPVKKPFGEFKNVLLTDPEHEKLIERFGGAVVQDKITALDLGIQSKGYKYKSHYATILNWDRMHKEKEKPLVEAF
jgi:hypothetical protein